MFVNSDDEWNPQAHRGDVEWLAAIDKKVNRKGTARGFKMYAIAKIQREAEELKEKTASEQQ